MPHRNTDGYYISPQNGGANSIGSATLERRNILAEKIFKEPLDPRRYLARAQCYLNLGYPDLAAGDTYKALELVETGLDATASDYPPEIYDEQSQTFLSFDHEEHADELQDLMFSCFIVLSECCSILGCFKDALTWLDQAKALDVPEFTAKVDHCSNSFRKRVGPNQSDEDIEDLLSGKVKRTHLANIGVARREVYAWNSHEPDRSASGDLEVLNEQLRRVAPKAEARSTPLPILRTPSADSEVADALTEHSSTDHGLSIQLGLFAKERIFPGYPILEEPSLLTSCRTIHSPLCDCCQSPLPSLASESPPVSCPSCETVFCSQGCSDLAQEKYHPATCDNDLGLEEIGRNPESKTPSDDLYLLLLARVIAMSETQDIHPLDLPEVKYLCGEFSSSVSTINLPFSLAHAVMFPHQILTAMSISPFSESSLHRYDTWVIQTLYAKFRGVASAKQSTWDGKPEVAAVHPFWSLANHSCDPNLKWEWPAPANNVNNSLDSASEEKLGNCIVMTVRTKDERPKWGGAQRVRDEWDGIEAGEEILNHYCDIRLPVQERRAWAMGPLGGECMCERCRWEAEQHK